MKLIQLSPHKREWTQSAIQEEVKTIKSEVEGSKCLIKIYKQY